MGGTLCSLLVLGLLGSNALGTTANTRAVSPQPVSLTAIHIITSTSGWALSANSILRMDGGVGSWTVSEALPLGSGENAALVVFKSHVRVAAQVSRTDFATKVFSTNDDGRSWHTVRVAGMPIDQGISGDDSALTFVDPRHGWLATTEGPAAGQAANEIYRTSNGGVSWRKVAYSLGAKAHGGVPSCECVGGVTFGGTRTGWLTGASDTIPSLPLYRSRNRGVSWQSQVLTIPRGFKVNANMATASPTFFGPLGILPAHLSSPPAFVLYSTSDGGVHWSSTTPIRTGGTWKSRPVADAFVLRPNWIWVWANNSLYRTESYGRRWQVIGRRLPFSGVPEFQFVTMKIGFAVGRSVSGSKESLLYETTNSGHTWHRINATITSA